MNIILFDTTRRHLNLLPLTHTRPVGDLRVGILKIAEKWQWWWSSAVQVSFLTLNYLQPRYPAKFADMNLYIAGNVLPNTPLVAHLASLPPETALLYDHKLIALYSAQRFHTMSDMQEYAESKARRENADSATVIDYTWDIFAQNRAQIISDFALITKGRKSQPVNDRYTAVYGEENIFIEEGVQIRASILNGEDGVIYLGKNSQVGEGSVIKGTFALCEGAGLNVGAKMRGDSTIGPYSKVGGEVSNSVLQGYSNKGHEGFLGNSVLGEWCNLGADTNTSNLKNNYAQVQVWNFREDQYINTGRQFCGLVMGDHAKAGINTMFNTGTVVGMGANIFGGDFPPKFIPPFAWGGAEGFSTFKFDKFCEMAEKMMERRHLTPTPEEVAIYQHVYEHTRKYRSWETDVKA